MKRRNVVTAIASGVAGLAGCLGGDAGGGFGGEEEETETADEEAEEFPDLSEAQRSFVTRLDEELDVTAARTASDAFVVEVQTTGDSDEDIRLAAEAYVNFVEQLAVDLRVHIEDRGLRQATFMVEAAWAEQFKTGEIDANEYLDRIAATRRS